MYMMHLAPVSKLVKRQRSSLPIFIGFEVWYHVIPVFNAIHDFANDSKTRMQICTNFVSAKFAVLRGGFKCAKNVMCKRAVCEQKRSHKNVSYNTHFYIETCTRFSYKFFCELRDKFPRESEKTPRQKS